MKKIFLLSFVACIAMSSVLQAQDKTPDNTLTKKEKKDGWKLLFDGKDLKGWHSYLRDTAAANWIVKDGQIQYDRDHDKAGNDLLTNAPYENYELQLQWRISKGGNSGIIFDIQEDPKFNATFLTGPEMQVLDNKDADDNKKQNHLAGCLYDMMGDSTISKPVPVGEWNQVKIIQNKGHLTFWLNGIKTVETQIGSPEWDAMIQKSKFKNKEFGSFAKVAAGKIALQKHPGASGWKNIKIREIKD
ncbi:DUF1080 domain-containing protein [Mucilaginibacter sp.]|uniref:3-keto-disaccharide hydrolase n=1 Tax=Mucilaginibacter sp. TaxID=1882438 RepID=UPI0026202788|nr:DUF1080 domain-containing protein [Mucilaginibacter sp.]MDB5030741.1 glycosyl hydrolase [Mucilaginibacter sp.]